MRTQDKELTLVGQFEVKGGKVAVSDPCYEHGTWCAAWGIPAVDGIYEAYIVMSDEGKWGNRVAEIIAVLKDRIKGDCLTYEDYDLMNWTSMDSGIGVDSGQCGIWSEGQYQPDGKGEYEEEDSWYGAICAKWDYDTPGAPKAHIFNNMGAFSSTGFGDGSYHLAVVFDDPGPAYGFLVTFIDDLIYTHPLQEPIEPDDEA